MNVLVLGNGFDLHYKLPTSYINFLHTVKYLCENTLVDIQNIGQIFSQTALQDADEDIKESYIKYKEIYDITPVEMQDINKMIHLLHDNQWFSYFEKSLNCHVNWIDFEKEMTNILDCIESYIPKTGCVIRFEDPIDAYIWDFFDFLKEKDIVSQSTNQRWIKDKYRIEYPLASGFRRADMEKITSELKKQLKNFTEALRLYLKLFVDNVSEQIKMKNKYNKIELLSYADHVITFNYTNTYEKFYVSNDVVHIHGNVNEQIVLGTILDETDENHAANIMFLDFSKYFQRIEYGTDDNYISWRNKFKNYSYHLFVMGHSLDGTDKDILVEMFDNAQEVTILCHKESMKMLYHKKLLALLGKEKHQILRREKNLQMLLVDNELEEITNKLNTEWIRKEDEKFYSRTMQDRIDVV